MRWLLVAAGYIAVRDGSVASGFSEHHLTRIPLDEPSSSEKKTCDRAIGSLEVSINYEKSCLKVLRDVTISQRRGKAASLQV